MNKMFISKMYSSDKQIGWAVMLIDYKTRTCKYTIFHTYPEARGRFKLMQELSDVANQNGYYWEFHGKLPNDFKVP